MRTFPHLHRIPLALASAALLALAGCGGGDDAQAVAQALGYAQVEANAFSGVRTARTQAVYNDAEWTALWAEHTSNVNPAPPRPAVDFGTQTVAAIFLGQTTACSRPQVDSVTLVSGPTIRINYRVVGPAPTELCAAVVTTPALMVRLPSVGRVPLEFVRVQ